MNGALTDTWLGWAALAWDGSGVRGLSLGDTPEQAALGLKTRVGDYTSAPLPSDFEAALQALSTEAPPPAPLLARGTEWQEKVWAQLRLIPPGHTSSYAELAETLGKPKTHARAVALACGANPIAIWIPCHRVVRGNGDLAGFRWGLARKAKLLARERELLL